MESEFFLENPNPNMGFSRKWMGSIKVILHSITASPLANLCEELAEQ
jgi:hypothetical protein